MKFWTPQLAHAKICRPISGLTIWEVRTLMHFPSELLHKIGNTEEENDEKQFFPGKPASPTAGRFNRLAPNLP